MTKHQPLLQKGISLLVIVSLGLSQALPVFAENMSISLSPDSSLTQAVTGKVQGDLSTTWDPAVKADLVTEIIDRDDFNPAQLFSLNEEKNEYALLAIFCEFIRTGKFTEEQILHLSTRIQYNLRRENNFWPVLAGFFVQNPQFIDFRSSLVVSLQMGVSSISLAKSPDYLLNLVQVFGEDPSLSSFTAKEKESIIRSLHALLDTYAKHLAEDRSSVRGQQSNFGLHPVRNEAVAARNYLDSTNFFRGKDGDNFWKGLITTFLPLRFPSPGRNEQEEFTTDLIGQQHRVCYVAIEILMGTYINQKQDTKVYDFIRYEAMGQGPYYMQFAVDGLSIANMYYSHLSESRYKQWDQLQTKLDNEIQSAAPWDKKVLSLLSTMSQVGLEWVTCNKIISVAWKGVKIVAASRLTRSFISMLPRSMVVRTTLANRWIRIGFHNVLSQSVTKIHTWAITLASRSLGREVISTNLAKKYIISAVEHSSFGELEKQEFKTFFKRVLINEADPETIRFLNSRLGRTYIGATELRTLKAQVTRWMNLKPNGNYRLVVRGGQWITEIEHSQLAGLNSLKNNIGQAIRGKTYQNGRIMLGQNKWIRFGKHELTSGALHIHVEELVSQNGARALINMSYKVKVKETLTEILSKDITQTWVLATQKQRKSGLEYIFTRFSPREIEQLFPSGSSGVLVRQLRKYYNTGEISALETLFKKVYPNTGLPTRWTEVEVEKVLTRSGRELIKSLQNGARSNATKQQILSVFQQALEKDISRMSNQKAGTMLQWMLLDGTTGRNTLGQFLVTSGVRDAGHYIVPLPGEQAHPRR